MAEEKKGTRRIIVPNPHKEVSAVAIPSVQDLLDDALSVLGSEVTRLRYQAQKQDPITKKIKGLNSSEARMLTGYIKSLVDLSKEARERMDDLDTANMSDEELKQLVTKMMQPKE